MMEVIVYTVQDAIQVARSSITRGGRLLIELVLPEVEGGVSSSTGSASRSSYTLPTWTSTGGKRLAKLLPHSRGLCLHCQDLMLKFLGSQGKTKRNAPIFKSGLVVRASKKRLT